MNFLRASKNTKFLYAKCKTKKVGRKLINIDCDVFDDNKKLIAIGRFTFMKI